MAMPWEAREERIQGGRRRRWRRKGPVEGATEAASRVVNTAAGPQVNLRDLWGVCQQEDCAVSVQFLPAANWGGLPAAPRERLRDGS